MMRLRSHLQLRIYLLWCRVMNGCMLGTWLLGSSVFSSAAHADTTTAIVAVTTTTTATSGVRVSLIKTADAQVREALMAAGGIWSTMLRLARFPCWSPPAKILNGWRLASGLIQQ